jgi:hypothetical protein
MDRTMRLFLTFLALLTGLSAAPAQARMNADGAEVERVEASSRGGAGAIAAAAAEIGAQSAARPRGERERARPRPPATVVLIPSIQYGDRARE